MKIFVLMIAVMVCIAGTTNVFAQCSLDLGGGEEAVAADAGDVVDQAVAEADVAAEDVVDEAMTVTE